MKVLVKRSVIIDGKHCEAGKEVEVATKKDATYLIGTGAVVAVEAKTTKAYKKSCKTHH